MQSGTLDARQGPVWNGHGWRLDAGRELAQNERAALPIECLHVQVTAFHSFPFVRPEAG